MIGIVGGMGPIAGIDLSRKIVNQTIASKDQEHITQILYSAPKGIGDRTEYILGMIEENPAFEIVRIILNLEKMGATAIGIPCNSAHNPEIFDVIRDQLNEKKAGVQLFHMVEEVGKFIKDCYPKLEKIGVLGTSGTYKTRQYHLIEKFGMEVINVSELMVKEVHESVYHPVYGIKTNTECISNKSKETIKKASDELIDRGAEAIILGCTELPLAMNEKYYKSLPLIDTTLILARALIKAVDPSKLKQWA